MDAKKLLAKQIKKHFTAKQIEQTPGLSDFIHAVQESYSNYEHNRKMSEHAFAISEMEYREINEKLNKEKEIIERGVIRLSNMIRAITPEFDMSKIDTKGNLLFIADMLAQQVSKQKILEQKLQDAIAKEKKASAVKSDFLATISHEIRSPLNVITSLSHILLQEAYLEEQAEHLEILQIASNSLLMLINDVLDFSKIESGKLELKKYAFDLHAFLYDVSKGFKPLAEEKSITFELEMSKDLPRIVHSDSLRIRQIIVNLVSNAIKFTEEGSVKLQVKCLDSFDQACAIRFEVVDTGIGIPKENLEHIFEEFYQTKTKYSHNGTGLGLSISKHLLKILQSEIQVESQYGIGSRFYFDLILDNADEKELLNHSKLNEVDFENIDILVVDDMPFNRLVIKKILNKWNLSIDFAENGEEAVHLVKEKHYELIFMDVHMPVMSGIEATKSIRTFNEDICIIALTASTDEQTQKAVLAAGMNDYISKPIIPSELHKIIQTRVKNLSIF